MKIMLGGNYPPFLASLETQYRSNQYKFNGSCRSCFAENFCSLFNDCQRYTYKAHTFNTVSLLAHMEVVCVTGDANTCARNIADRVKEACDARGETA